MTEHQTTTDAVPTSRRALLIGAGGVGATVALAACGTGDDDTLGNGGANAPAGTGSTDGTDTDGTDTGGDTGSGGEGLTTSQVPVGGGVILAAQGVVVTQPAEGEFKAFSNICTHQGCPVANLDGGTINCTCHFSSFSIEDGSVVSGPAPSPLEEKTVTVDGESLTVA
ncbi:Rieske 2Fe-2S domain-containing protein [Solwaraspora sp. WMMD791]|uniref:Rieske (2Fe-2S) protein n=1 Tax=Solwaraspora sp. WMMD791 TaxID=3016086 RepID=UPI00249A63CE|nr:Rieske 2Fe-2S domain-containing protein [Solwaraspora sp. WMMD791]WFE27869.1 Rieske 2Fe-2S domain-containing protein [Solwaraspora sp. WMMD791]